MTHIRRSGFAWAGAALVLTGLLAGCSSTPQAAAPLSAAPPAAPGLSTSTDPSSFTVVATGDILIHPALTDQAEADGGGTIDYRQILAGVKPLVSSADLAICHLETPLAPEGGPYTGYPSFSAPPQIAEAIKDTGYDTCSTASNHTLDKGAAGITRTLDKLDEVGLKHTGSARSAAEAAKPLILDVHGVKVAQLSFAFGFNGIKVPAGKPWLANEIDADDILEAAHAAREAGAQVVIASLHWGVEYHHEVTDDQSALARKLLASPDLDLIVGHHAHVVQPFAKVEGKWVAYGLGNEIARHDDPRGSTEEGNAARFTFTQTNGHWAVSKAEYLPTLIDLGPPIRLRDLTTAPHTARGDEALKNTDEVVLSEGAGDDGLTRPGK
ncbi:CapA family protein [Amycolatopsis rhabdoformis]|uniref:CapA family protein n=1 Tax=Amycolatopsis rhabdoformis TaxID=1448059 RepID=A0ABZ1I6G0_9PSEU|nr:CapA family protein [Amycolatopsis rhabdoformis]WSE30029.1 CapA family protein [Amycolatopsis rhabdoformis]